MASERHGARAARVCFVRAAVARSHAHCRTAQPRRHTVALHCTQHSNAQPSTAHSRSANASSSAPTHEPRTTVTCAILRLRPAQPQPLLSSAPCFGSANAGRSCAKTESSRSERQGNAHTRAGCSRTSMRRGRIEQRPRRRRCESSYRRLDPHSGREPTLDADRSTESLQPPQTSVFVFHPLVIYSARRWTATHSRIFELPLL